ncbi:MAG: S41 family peptidase [Woeseiaceae bacterium]
MYKLAIRTAQSLLVALLISGPVYADHAPVHGSTLLSAEAAAKDIEIARDRLEAMHAGYDRYTGESTLSDMWDALESRSSDGISRGDLYIGISRILAAIRCDHTKAELPDDMAAARNTERVYLPFRFVLFSGRMYVDTPAAKSELSRGDQILSIDGRRVAWWLAKVEPLIPVDGDATHVVPLELAYSTEFMGPALDHFAPFFADIDGTVRLQVRSTDGREFTVTTERLTFPDFQSMVGEKRYSSNFADSIRFERLGDNAAYLAVDTFVNYRKPVDAAAHLAPYFESLKQENRDKLIVDLRNNGGGSDDAQLALLQYLINRPAKTAEALLTRFDSLSDGRRQYLSTWNEAALYPDPAWFEPLDNGYFKLVAPGLAADSRPLQPAELAFEGDLVVLIGPANSSGSTHLVAVLANAERGLLVGEKTGGAPTGATAGIIYFLTLPESGIKIRIPGQRTVMANADRLPARDGITPEIPVTASRDAYFAGRDAALDAAKDALDIN